ncbi:MFS transporter [Microbacterium sp. ASV81]|uniref:MFS transporter n=1 Tax=Microbacterium capsulatum TaxID=3041921 RepID=A0ABU0XEQ3_9MICO|nr:MFS transporter [Microbacterium sp. ASV81]MDQ4213596.1 MFS transporter [Microbacterium sp. ASV81]
MTNPVAQRSAVLPLVLLVAAILADGFDTASLGFIVPVLSKLWGTSPAAFSIAFVATNIGAVIGYLLSGRLSARIGAARVVPLAVALYSAAVVLTVFAGSIPVLIAIRLITGIGLGAVLPAAVSLGTALVQPRRRPMIAIIVTLGIAAGATLSGLVGAPLIAGLGWQSAFWVPGVFALVLAPILLLVLRGIRTDARPAGSVAPAGVGSLFAPGLRSATLLLWAYSFLVFITLYLLQSWLPTLVIQYGIPVERVSSATAAFSAGSVVGGLALALLSVLIPAPRIIVALSVLTGAVLVVIGATAVPAGGLLLLVAVSGIGAAAGTNGQAGLAVALYGEHHRTVGVGWAAAAGRIGSIVGPALGGVLLGMHAPASSIILLTVIPVVLSIVVLLLFAAASRRSPASTADDASDEAVAVAG